jgi:predicted phage baseplate assembly protein
MRQSLRVGDTFYMGFDPARNISGHILRFDFTCKPTEAVGIRREDPPWVWECLNADGVWDELRLSTAEGEKDTTGGLNNPSGQLVVSLPLKAVPANLYGLNAFWLRCRIEQRNTLQGMYSESPRVTGVEVYSLGAKTTAMHSVNVENEELGRSSGEAGQTFTLAHAPLLTLQDGETLEVQEFSHGEDVFVPWQQVEDFSNSTQFDRHYRLDMASGTLSFGPSVRQPDGTVIQYGRIPESGRPIRFSKYRYGGGVSGNLPVASLSTLSMSIAYISRVSNLVRATGGRDQETLDELKMRAQRELQAQRRAVTAQDYEQFTISCSRAISRAKCLSPVDTKGKGVSGTVSVLVVPSVADALAANSIASLHVDDKLLQEVRSYLDKYRLITTSLNVREPRYKGVKVKARVVPHDFIQPTEVVRQVNEELNRYLSPIAIDEKQPMLKQGETWEGWPFGRDLFTAEVISLIQQVPSVKYVLDVEVFSRDVIPVEEISKFDDEAPRELSLVDKVLQVSDDGLLCSLGHEIECVDIDIVYQKG